MPLMKRPALLLAVLLAAAGCYDLRPSSGGGQTKLPTTRTTAASDIVLPPGYRIEAVAHNLNMPTAVTFDDAGNVYVIESGYSYGEVFTTPKLLKLGGDGSTTT